MPGYRKKTPTRNMRRLFGLLGVQFPEDMPVLTKTDSIELNSHTEAELRYMPGFALDDKASLAGNTTGQLQSYLQGIAQHNNDWTIQSDAIRVLTPEIDRSSEIMVSSIISPTDMQTDTINIVCEDSDLGDEIETKIGDELSKFFNDTLDIGSKTYKYTKEALYGSGSASILILPPSNIDILNKALDVDHIKSGRIKRTRGGKVTVDASAFGGSDKQGAIFASSESLLPSGTDTKDSLASIESLIEYDLQASLEKFNPFVSMKTPEVITNSREARSKILDLFRETNKSIVISSDAGSLGRHRRRLEQTTNRLEEEVAKNFLFDKNNPTFFASTSTDTSETHNPAVIEIPTRAVVPVIVPGSPDTHIGYFILVDQWGTPLAQMSSDRQTSFGPRKLTEAATQAAFGSPTLYKFNSQITDEQRYDMTSTIFGITLKHLLENKLDEYGLGGTTIEEYDAVSSCMFRHLLMRKKCALVFVPEQLMVYFRFDHRADGTGKSITESMSTMLALRTVLLMSYIMAATENSVDNKTISVNVDEKQTNIQQYLDMVRNAYVAKKMMRFDVNPLTVQQDLIQKSLTILPKGLKGISDSLDVQTEHRSTGSIAPDEQLLEKLTNWIITWLEVPHAALNQLGDNEYARSVATTNLFFSNNVRGKQKVVTKHMTKFVRLYTKYSKYLRDKIIEILKATGDTSKATASNEAKNTPKATLEVETNDENIMKNVQKAINCLKISLPSPRIVVDKAQYKEIEEYLGAIEKLTDTIYSDDMLPGDASSDLSDMMKTIRASIREKLARDYIDNIGFQSSYTIPFTNEISLEHIQDLVLMLANQKKGIQDVMEQIVQKAGKPKDENPDDGGDNPPSDSGSDDMNFDDEGNPPDLDNPDENPSETPNTEGGENDESGSSGDNINPNQFDDFPPPPTF